MAFKMRGNPMQRNFGIGSPIKLKDPHKGTSKDEQEGADSRAKTAKEKAERAEKHSQKLEKFQKRHEAAGGKYTTPSGKAPDQHRRRANRLADEAKKAKEEAERLRRGSKGSGKPGPFEMKRKTKKVKPASKEAVANPRAGKQIARNPYSRDHLLHPDDPNKQIKDTKKKKESKFDIVKKALKGGAGTLK